MQLINSSESMKYMKAHASVNTTATATNYKLLLIKIEKPLKKAVLLLQNCCITGPHRQYLLIGFWSFHGLC